MLSTRLLVAFGFLHQPSKYPGATREHVDQGELPQCSLPFVQAPGPLLLSLLALLSSPSPESFYFLT